jgi:TonB-dependent receptor
MSQWFYYLRNTIAPAILIALLLVPQCLLGQGTSTVKGRVFDRKTGDPLPGANVIVVGTSLGASTNLDGRYDIRSVPDGKQSFRASYIGYITVTIERTVSAGATNEFEIGLNAQAVTGEEVIVTAQAQGQNAAINQQLSSNTISNIVSAARIKELPDVNAAESIGRLPGVAISRYNGEASTVVIRGLSAKYNTITVNGVALPATGGDDRSVDLSMISSNILDGIEVKKANTPDMEATALGGTVDLKLREAPADPTVALSAQMGYNKLQDYYGNYAFAGNISRRFLDGDLGIIASLNADRYNRAADKFRGTWQSQKISGVYVLGIQSVELRDESVTRKRAGGSLLADYNIPFGKVTANGFYNKLSTDLVYRINRPDREHGSHYYEFDQDNPSTNIFTAALGVKQDLDLFSYDLTLSRTGSYTDDPDNRSWSFSQENAAFPNSPFNTDPFQLPYQEVVDSNKTGFQSAYIATTKRWEYQNSLQLNFKVPFTILDEVPGYVKFGGAYRWMNRANDETQWGRDGLQYGQTSVNPPLTAALKMLAQLYPNEFNWTADSTLARQYGQLPITRFLDRSYTRKNFLDGRWPQGMVANLDLLNKFTDALSSTTEWTEYSLGSLSRDYSGVERYQAAYLMTELNWRGWITVIPGVRFERYFTAYHGQVFRDNKPSNVEKPPADYEKLYVERDNQFWLPMVHLIVNPFDWMKIRVARTATLTQPDYMMYAPITSMNSYNSYSRAANSKLKPAESHNWDASISIFDNNIGLFSISGFYKDVYDLILQTRIDYTQPQGSDDPGYPLPDGLNIPKRWLSTSGFQIDTYTNNPARAIYKGYEIEWQTHFWYLPSVLQGLVLNANYTRIYSQTYKQMFNVVSTDILIPGHRPPIYQKKLVESSAYERMPDQPAHTVNVSLGYDYKDFSARVIFLYQSDRTVFISYDEAFNTYVADYYRWDLTFQQKLDYGLTLFANLNNLNNRHDETFEGFSTSNTTYLEYYGFTMDVGVRWSL